MCAIMTEWEHIETKVVTYTKEVLTTLFFLSL